MINEMRDFVLELVQSEYETGHRLAEDRTEFNELCRDEGYRATKAMYDLYEECHNLGPAGFYAEYKDELDFDPMFISEYGDEDNSKSSTDSIDSADGFNVYDRVHVKEFDFNGEIIDITKASSGRTIAKVRRDAADGFFDPYLFYLDELEPINEEFEGSDLKEDLSNKQKLKRAYPELNFDNNVTETLIEAVDSEDKMQTAVGILYDMDNFVLSVYDNDYWLSMGVPDGEFDETHRDIAEANYKDHEWLIEGDEEGSFDREAFKDLLDAFQVATHGKDYDQNERTRIIHEAETILNMNESWEEDEYETSERYFIYDENDQCVSNGYSTLNTAAKKAQEADYPAVKIHRYFRDENGKLQPDGDPELVWTSGDPITESYDEDGNHEKCEECGALLNDAGECPKCIHGDEEASEQLDEEILTEGPFNSIKRKMAKADAKRNSEIDKLANPKTIGKILFSTYKDAGNSYLIDGKLMKSRDVLEDLKKAIESLYEIDNSLTTISKDKLDPNLIKFIDAVVIDRNGYIIRRGLELIKPKTLEYNPNRLDVLKIKDGFKSDDILEHRPLDVAASKDDSDTEKAADSSSSIEDAAAVETPEEKPSETSPVEHSQPAKADWVTNDSIKAAITLRAKRKNGNVAYYDKEGNLVDYRKINLDNVADVFVDKEGEVPFIKAMEEIKAGLAKRKTAAIKSAALFGESLDDEMEYDNLDEKVITHDSLHDGDMEELLDLAKDIGIHTMGELEQFAEREVPQGTSLIDTLRQYRDDLGDDFELREEVLYPTIETEDVNDAMDEDSLTWK